MPTLKSIRRAYRDLNRQQSGKRIAELRKLAKQRAKRLRVDPREPPLNEAARRVTIENDYDPNFSSLEERVVKETKLFLARLDALPTNIAPPNGGRLWQQRQTHDIVTELGRGVMDMDAIKGTRIVVYRDDQSERVRFATENHFHLMYEPVE